MLNVLIVNRPEEWSTHKASQIVKHSLLSLSATALLCGSCSISNLKLVTACFSFGGRKKPEIMTEPTEKKVSSEVSVIEDRQSIWRQLVFHPKHSWQCLVTVRLIGHLGEGCIWAKQLTFRVSPSLWKRRYYFFLAMVLHWWWFCPPGTSGDVWRHLVVKIWARVGVGRLLASSR